MNYQIRFTQDAKTTCTNCTIPSLIATHPFGDSGYVALFEIEPRHEVTVLAVRHQREDDYH